MGGAGVLATNHWAVQMAGELTAVSWRLRAKLLMANDSLRLFVAIDLPSEVKALLAELQAQLRIRTEAVRWSDPQGTHLTLKFLGNVPRVGVDAVVDGMCGAAQLHQRFQLQTGQLGMFPNTRRPRVVWLGVEGDTATLAQLQSNVERFIAPLGFPTEQRSFSPHLTLGRTVKDPASSELASIGEAVSRTEVPRVIPWDVREVILMRSELGPRGARYTPLHVAHLEQAE